MPSVCTPEKLKNFLVGDEKPGMIARALTKNINIYNDSEPQEELSISESTIKCIVNAVIAIIDDNPQYITNAIEEAMNTTTNPRCWELAYYWSNAFANLVIMKTRSEGFTEVKCGHGLLALRHSDGWGWGRGE